MFTFLHAADIHLDSPLKNLAIYEGAPVEVVRGATRRALTKLVDEAIGRRVDLLLLAGDIYDGSWKDYNTGLFFIDRMQALRRAGIRVFLVSGNHDAASTITKTLRLPENVVHFPHDRPRTVLVDECNLAVHGQSHARKKTTANLARNYPPPVAGRFNIGLLHTALSGRPGHQPYAPCTKGELIDKGYDYWALGHVHQREVVARDPWIIFPGNPQGRHIRESGARSATLVRVEGDRVTEVSELETDVVRWNTTTLDCTDMDNAADLTDEAARLFEQEAGRADNRPLMLRLELAGRTPLHRELIRDGRYWENSLRGLAIDCGDLWLEKILFRTSSPSTGEITALEGSPLEHFLGAEEPDMEQLFNTPELLRMSGRLPPELEREQPLVPEDPAVRRQLLEEIREMLVAEILERPER